MTRVYIVEKYSTYLDGLADQRLSVKATLEKMDEYQALEAAALAAGKATAEEKGRQNEAK